MCSESTSRPKRLWAKPVLATHVQDTICSSPLERMRSSSVSPSRIRQRIVFFGGSDVHLVKPLTADLGERMQNTNSTKALTEPSEISTFCEVSERKMERDADWRMGARRSRQRSNNRLQANSKANRRANEHLVIGLFRLGLCSPQVSLCSN
mmetsp:Transcript_83699/g.270638  ORF Transcript_83699/g.270638 Transcript_83699/m.270638 type:complete len:151 (+) Transcript_83699:172-624(+)